MGDIEQAYSDGLVDPCRIPLENVKGDLAKGKALVLARLAADPHQRLVQDTAAEMESWACLQEEKASVMPSFTNLLSTLSQLNQATPKKLAETSRVLAAAARNTKSAAAPESQAALLTLWATQHYPLLQCKISTETLSRTYLLCNHLISDAVHIP